VVFSDSSSNGILLEVKIIAISLVEHEPESGGNNIKRVKIIRAMTMMPARRM